MKKERSMFLKAIFMTLVFCFIIVEVEAATCDAEPTNMSVSYGEQVTCGINPAADTDLFRFSGNQGDRILAEALFVSGSSFTPRISLIAPDGAEIADTYFPARIDMVLPQTGNYTAIISEDNSRQFGEYAFTVSCTSGDCFSIPVLPPSPGGNSVCETEPTDMFAQFGERVSCNIDPAADTDLYRFSGYQGDRILAEALFVSGSSFIPRISLIAPSGEKIVDTYFPARIDLVLPQTGNYTAIISEDNSRQFGEYAFTISCTSGNCLSLGDNSKVLDIDANGSIDALTDGLLFIRYLFGFRENTLIDGVVSSNCKRCSSSEIEDHLQN